MLTATKEGRQKEPYFKKMKKRVHDDENAKSKEKSGKTKMCVCVCVYRHIPDTRTVVMHVKHQLPHRNWRSITKLKEYEMH